MGKRVKRIFENISDDIDILVLINHIDPLLDQSFFYVTGCASGLFESCVAFLYPDGRCDVLVSELEETSARSGDCPITVFSSREEYRDEIRSRLKGIKNIGINNEELIYSKLLLLKELAPEAEFSDCSQAVTSARMIKDSEEVRRIQKACDIASRTAEKIPEWLEEGIRENEVAAEMEYFMAKSGSSSPSFETISSFGKNSAEPHYTAGQSVLGQDMFALFDFGATYMRYISDLTRTFFFGTPSQKDKDMYETVRRAQQIGFDSIEAGRPLSEPHINVADYINSTKFEGRFIHSLGHSIGLSVHEPVRFSPLQEGVMEPGMVITVEPGVYLPGYGGVRIEDDVLIKKDGIKILTSAPRELMCI